MEPIPRLEDLPDLTGKSVLLRADFNVPISGGEITDNLRIRAALPTIRWLAEQGASVTARTHLGRPQGEPDSRFSVQPIREYLTAVAPQVRLLENLRFDPRETTNDATLVRELIDGHDAYVNDAFGASHRAHASIVGPPQHLPSAAGRLLTQEVEVLSGLRANPRRPFVAVLGGSKVSDKLAVIEALLESVDALIVGGAMCFTFLAAQGHAVGASLCETDMIDTCARLLDGPVTVHLPSDITALAPPGEIMKPELGGEVRQLGVDLPAAFLGVDIGPGSAAAFADLIADAGTVLWNGPMGVFEDPRFGAGTATIAQAMADTKAFTVVGGGDSAAAIKRYGQQGEIDHVSTGGGASLAFIEQGDLVGLRALRGAENGHS